MDGENGWAEGIFLGTVLVVRSMSVYIATKSRISVLSVPKERQVSEKPTSVKERK